MQVRTIMDLDERCEMVEARIAYDKDPRAFEKLATEESYALTKKLEEARARLSQVKLAPELSLKVRRPWQTCSKRLVRRVHGEQPSLLPTVPPPR